MIRECRAGESGNKHGDDDGRREADAVERPLGGGAGAIPGGAGDADVDGLVQVTAGEFLDPRGHGGADAPLHRVTPH